MQDICQRIRERDESVIRELYTLYFKPNMFYILNKGGTMDDAEDMFQEAVIALYENCQKEGFQIKIDVKPYLAAIVRNKWAAALTMKKRIKVVGNEPDESLPEDTTEIEEKEQLEEMYQILYAGIEQISEECRRLIIMTFDRKLKDKKIAELMNYSEKFVPQKRRRCIKKLQELVG